MEIKLTSPAFEHNSQMPAKYTCDSQNISPPLQWENIPDKTKTIALICDDPDAPMGTWVHWVLYNLPKEKRALEENYPDDETLEKGIRQGFNDFGNIGYGGPCPPGGTHRYFFKIYALDCTFGITQIPDKKMIENLMTGHILATGQLIGKYTRKT